MTVATASRFLAMLALVAMVGGGVLWVAWWRRATWLQNLRPVALLAAWLVAATAVTGSLYYSEVAHFTPCRLCWFQRIGIYPLVVLLGVAMVRGRDDVRPYIWALGALTAPVSLWHLLLQNFPSLEGGTCDPSAPCSVRWVQEFGIVSIPFMALATVVAVTALVAVAGPPRRGRPSPTLPKEA